MKRALAFIFAVFFSVSAVADSSFVAPTANGTAATGQIPGTTTNDNASTGNVGEFVSASLVSGSATSLVTDTAKTIISLSLTAGDWDITGTCYFTVAGTTTLKYALCSPSLVTNQLDNAAGNYTGQEFGATGIALGESTGLAMNAPTVRRSISITTTMFLIGQSGFGVSTNAAWGLIRARRVR